MAKENLKKELIKNTFWGFLSTAMNRIGTLILTIILARFLLPESYGLYSLVLSTAMIFYTFADLGISKAFTRYLSFSLAKEKEKIKAYYIYFVKIKLFLAIGTSILLAVLSYPLSLYFFRNPALFYPLLISSMYIFILSLENFYSQIFYSAEKIQYISIKEVLNFSLKILFILAVFQIVARGSQVSWLFVVFAIVSFLLLMFDVYFSNKLIPALKKDKESKINKKQIWHFIKYMGIASISTSFFAYVDAITIGFFLAPEYVGYYRAAFSLVFGVLGFVAFPNLILLPVFTKLAKLQTEHVFNYAFKYMAMLALPITFGLVLVGKYFIGFFYGYAYLPAIYPLYILSLLIFPAMGVSLLLSLFSSKEKPELFAKLIVMSSILNIFLNILLIKLLAPISPKFGIMGAAIATTLSWFFYFGGAVYYAKKEMSFRIHLPSIMSPLISSIIMFGSLFFLFKDVLDMTFIIGITEIFLGAIIYFIMMVFIGGITKKDFEIFKSVIR